MEAILDSMSGFHLLRLTPFVRLCALKHIGPIASRSCLLGLGFDHVSLKPLHALGGGFAAAVAIAFF